MFFHSVAKDSTKYKRNLMVLLFFEGTSLIGEIFAICLLAKKCSFVHIENTTKKEGECQVYQEKEGECQV